MYVLKPNTPQERVLNQLRDKVKVGDRILHFASLFAAGNLDFAAEELYAATEVKPAVDPLKEKLGDAPEWTLDNQAMTATRTYPVVSLSADERNAAVDVEAQSRVDVVSGDQRTKNLKFMNALRQFRNARRGNNVDDTLLDALEVEAQQVAAIYAHAEALKADPDLDANWPS